MSLCKQSLSILYRSMSKMLLNVGQASTEESFEAAEGFRISAQDTDEEVPAAAALCQETLHNMDSFSDSGSAGACGCETCVGRLWNSW